MKNVHIYHATEPRQLKGTVSCSMHGYKKKKKFVEFFFFLRNRCH